MHWDDRFACCNGVEKVLQDPRLQIGGLTGVGGEPHPARNVIDRVKVAYGPHVGQHPVKHTTPCTLVAARVSGRVGVPTSSSAVSTPVGKMSRTRSAI